MGTANIISAGALAGLFCAIPAGAQHAPAPIRDRPNAELFVHVGLFRAGSDEGTIGRGLTYGGALVVPLRNGFALDLDAQTGTVERESRFVEGGHFYRTRRTLVIPSLLYRFGTRRVYGFAGGGLGAEFEKSTNRQTGIRPTGQPWQEIEPGLFELKQSEASRKLSFRGGFAAFLTENLGLRGDVFVAGWHIGARIGVGYRFGSP